MKTIHSQIQSPSSEYPFHQPLRQIAFFDIETTGLSPRTSSIYLIGAMRYDTDRSCWDMTQWFADDYRSEADILTSFLDFLKPCHALFHFNGATFDIPYVEAKCQKHGISLPEYAKELFQNICSHQTPTDEKRIGIDLLKQIRPLKKALCLQHARQTELERWLGIHREDTYHGGELIKVYTDYMQRRILHPESAEELEKLLLLHNHDDMEGMLHICSMLSYWNALAPSCPPDISGHTAADRKITIRFTLKVPVPKKIQIEHPFPDETAVPFPAQLTLSHSEGILSLPLRQDTLKFFLTPYQEYFYLPQEDTAIHKSVAQFVDSAFRRKATAATCYTKKEGSFLPSLSRKVPSRDEPLFYTGYKEKPAYYLLADSSEEDKLSRQLGEYLFYELPAFTR